MSTIRTTIGTLESARRERFAPAGSVSATDVQKAIEEVDADVAGKVDRTGTIEPIVILATGQSNFVQRPAHSWTPAPNILSWNYNDTDGNVGTAFVAVPGATINLPEKIASDIAYADPIRRVYIIGIAIGSQSIAQWMSGASAPDMYANITANIVPALAAIGATKIDGLFWWQGENQTASPELYVANFNTVMDRFKAETWFPRATPVTIFGLAPSTISGSIATDAVNAALQATVRAEPDVRRMVYTGTLGASYWADTLHPNGPGFFAIGQLGADAYLRGQTHLPMLNPLTGGLNAAAGRPSFRNLLRGGDFTTNHWRYGSSFSSVANGANVLDNFTYVSAGAGVVDILKTADAPSVAQAGIFTQHSLHVDVTTADASLASSDYYGVAATISGLDASFLGFGQPGAKSLVISFWVKATVAGNYFVAVENSAQNRSYASQFTVNASDTWEFKRVVVSGDTAGTWLYTSDVGLRVFWTIASGDAYLFTPEVWSAGDVRVGNVTRANGMSSTSNNFKLALVQVEEGVYPSAFDRLPALDGGIFSGPITTLPGSVKTADHTMLATDSALIFNGAGPLTLTLLSPGSVPGQWLSLKTVTAQPVVSASANVVPLAGGAPGTALLAATAGKWARLQSLGGFWVIMEAN